MEKLELPYMPGVSEMLQLLWIIIWQFLIKVNLHLPNDMSILSLSNYLGEAKTCPQKDIYKCL